MTEIDELYDVADDGEASVLDDLLHRAGLRWDCTQCNDDGGGARWTNRREDRTCTFCGKPRPEAVLAR